MKGKLKYGLFQGRVRDKEGGGITRNYVYTVRFFIEFLYGFYYYEKKLYQNLYLNRMFRIFFFFGKQIIVNVQVFKIIFFFQG